MLLLSVVIVIIDNYCSLYQSDNRLAAARKINPDDWDLPYKNQTIKDKYKIVMMTTHGAEWTEGKYIQKAAQNLGWELKLYYYSTQGHEKEILEFDPDFIITTVGNSNFHISPEIVNHRSNIFGLFYWAVNTDIINSFVRPTFGIFPEYYFDKDLDPNSSLFDMLNISDGILVSAKEIKIFEEYFEEIKKPFYAIRVVPSVNREQYSFKSPSYISIMGTLKDEKRSGGNFKTLFKKLDDAHILKTYGDQKSYNFIPDSYMGIISNQQQLLDEINKNSILLVLHRKNHFNNGIPTNRIMEGAAACALIISDKNPFVIENFGDSVLYFDADQDGETMYNQIMAHYNWAKANPKEAERLANKSHQIFLDKFTAEGDLIRIAKMNTKILEDKKNKQKLTR